AVAQRGVGAPDQRCRPGDVRRRHGRAAVARIGVVRRRAQNGDAGRGQIDSGGAVVGEAGQLVGAGGGGDGDDVVVVVVRRVVGDGVVVAAGVARGGDEDAAGGAEGGDGVGHGRGRPAAAPAVVGDLYALAGGVVQGEDGVAGAAAAVGAEELQRRQRHLPVDADDAGAVVSRRADGAGDVGAVAVVVEGVVVVVDEVPADQVVLVAVAVLIDAVGPARVGQQVAGIDVTIAVQVAGLAGVGGHVEVAEGLDAVAVGVHDAQRGGDLALVEPDVLVQVRVAVI